MMVMDELLLEQLLRNENVMDVPVKLIFLFKTAPIRMIIKGYIKQHLVLAE
jgi:hypothetical protein